MSSFTGTSFDDLILRDHLSSGVSADPAGLTGTLGDGSNVIDAGGGNDVVEAGDYGDVIAGGAGLDTIWGGLGTDFIDGGTGADRMFGGAGLDFYTVDSYHDVVFDDGTTPDDVADFIVTNLNYTLSETAGVECLLLGDEYFGIAATPHTIYGGGNSRDNTVEGNAYGNILDGKAGNDIVEGLAGDDLVLGGAGDDDAQGWEGADTVRGQEGNDWVWSGAGRDVLCGGRGSDTFFFNYADESVSGARDAIRAGDGTAAFEGAGADPGDLIWMPNAASSLTASVPFDFGAFEFGGIGEGQVSCVDRGQDTLVRANIDDDATFEFQVLIADGHVRASTYTADDFVLG